MELPDMLDTFIDDAEDQLVPDTATKKAMTKAGAEVFAKHLKANTPRTAHRDVKYGHLQDNVTLQNTDIGGEDNGNSVVGFGKKAYVARFLNDGTIKMEANHFVDNTRREANSAVLAAERKIYEQRGGTR